MYVCAGPIRGIHTHGTVACIELARLLGLWLLRGLPMKGRVHICQHGEAVIV